MIAAILPGRVGAGLRRLAGRLRNRPDTEHEMVLNRVVIAVLILAYLTLSSDHHEGGVYQPLMVATFFAICAVGFVVHILARPGVSVIRRVAAMTLDLVALSYGMHVGEGVTALLYPMYLWTIFGNGFRFGIPYLRAAAAISVVGFGFVIYQTEYWRDNLWLGVGLLAGLVVLPLYAGALIRKLSDATRKAEEASRSKSLFLASISHELRTPLNAVIGMSDLLNDTPLEAEQRDMAGTIRTSARALLGLIEELLNFSRLEAGRMPAQNVDFDLHQALTEVRSMMEVQARAKGVQLGLHVTARTPYRLHGDRRHLQEILVNLVGNAIKFTAAGSVVITADLAGGEAGRNRIRFQVSDTGIGIKPEAIGRIFESFTQADETVLDRFGGTGLGLAICKQLVELLGGQIGVESEFGEGSTFWFELEFAESVSAEQPGVSGLRVVLLSQDRTLEASLIEAVSGIGFLERAADPEAAARLLATTSGPSGRVLMLVDSELPDWREATASLSKDGAANVSAVLLVSENAEEVLPRPLQSSFVAGLCRVIDRRAFLAVANLAGGQSHAAPTLADAIAEGSGRSLSILVAEDNSVNQKVVTKILERGGHKVRVVANGEEAVDVLLAEPFDLVLMDVNMPVMSGIEATKLYRFAALGRDRVPIVALTADATPDARERCLEAGMDACLSKPIEPAELFRTINALTAGATPAVPASASETVTEIAAHPRFKAEVRAAIDARTLGELEILGGRAFVVELAEQFIEEGRRILGEIRSSIDSDDVAAFHDRLHALRSGAANLGATGLYELCLSLRTQSHAQFAAQGRDHLARIEAEFERSGKYLEEYCSREAAGAPLPISRLPRKAPG